VQIELYLVHISQNHHLNMVILSSSMIYGKHKSCLTLANLHHQSKL